MQLSSSSKQVRLHCRFNFKATQNGNISSIDFDMVSKEVEKYRRFKADRKKQAKAEVKQTKEQREELLE